MNKTIFIQNAISLSFLNSKMGQIKIYTNLLLMHINLIKRSSSLGKGEKKKNRGALFFFLKIVQPNLDRHMIHMSKIKK